MMARDGVDDRVACLESGPTTIFKPYRKQRISCQSGIKTEHAWILSNLVFDGLVLDLAARAAAVWNERPLA